MGAATTGPLASPVSRPAKASDRHPSNPEEPYAEHYYPPAAASYPMPPMSLRMQPGRDHRRGNSGELFYSPGGPYPVRAGRYYPQEYEQGEDPEERPPRPPPEYTPPAAYLPRPRPPRPLPRIAKSGQFMVSALTTLDPATPWAPSAVALAAAIESRRKK